MAVVYNLANKPLHACGIQFIKSSCSLAELNVRFMKRGSAEDLEDADP